MELEQYFLNGLSDNYGRAGSCLLQAPSASRDRAGERVSVHKKTGIGQLQTD